MNKINPNFHQRKSIRLPEYDYSQAGLYFITICTQNRECIFGDVINGEMVLNDAGMMVEKWYYELENKFSDIRCHEMIVMPNHFHCIVENVGDTVGADLRVCPNINDDNMSPITGEHTGSPLRCVCPNINDDNVNPIMGEHAGSPLHRVVQWFKTMTTNEYIRGVKSMGWQSFDGKLWQRNYYEHIIRNEQSFQNISEYIINNPSKWNEDKF
ncbi:MAG: transposase [Flavobacteriales bacterium]|nr:transposase [Flavobacteriales bacterium]